MCLRASGIHSPHPIPTGLSSTAHSTDTPTLEERGEGREEREKEMEGNGGESEIGIMGGRGGR